MVQLLVGVEHPQGVLRGGAVVAQHQIQLVVLPPPPGDGGDGVVGLPAGLVKDAGGLVAVAPPGGEDAVRQLDKGLLIPPGQANHRHGPAHNSRFNPRKTGEGKGLLQGGPLHGKGVPPPLEMVVAEDRPPHNGQVGIAPHKIVGELGDKIQLLAEGGRINFHGDMGPVKEDAVLVVVDIGGILEEPILAVDGHRDDPQVLAGGVVHPAGVPLVFPAELALGVAALGGLFGGGDGAGVLFRLGKVDGDVQIPVLRGGHPLAVAGDALPADVVYILAEGVVPVGGALGGIPVPAPELPDDLGGPGG